MLQDITCRSLALLRGQPTKAKIDINKIMSYIQILIAYEIAYEIAYGIVYDPKIFVFLNVNVKMLGLLKCISPGSPSEQLKKPWHRCNK